MTPGHALTAAATSAVVSVLVAGLSVTTLNMYGALVFLALPVVMGLVVSIVLHRLADVTWLQVVGVIILTFLIAAVGMLLFAVEGLVCLVMALPIGFPLALVGAAAGRHAFVKEGGPISLSLGLLLLPMGAGVDLVRPPDGPLHEVRSMVEINAPPEAVWPLVLAFPPLPEPTEWYFRTGLAYPQYASIDGEGVGATRLCVFSTGPFVEPITVWDPARRLAFNVTSSPAPLRELSPYPDLHPPHLKGFLQSRRGEFRLVPLPGGRTRLEGSTWYELDMAPGPYWRFITDRVIQKIHGRVLTHIKTETERRLAR